MANVTLRLVKGTPLTNSEVDNNFSNLNITKTEIGGDLGGNVFTPRVTGLQGRTVSNAAPSNAQVLTWSVTSNTWLPSNAVALYSELQTKPGVNVIIIGDVVGNANIVLANTSTNIITINTSFTPTNFDSRYVRLSSATQQIVTGPISFEGNVTFNGDVTTISANNLIIEDNFIYLNNQSINTNVDFGFVGNYNDGVYAHAGFFRDASDQGTWKIFDGYIPEPDANINIDTSNATFRLANLQINTITANTIRGISNTTLVTNLNADLLDNQQGTYYIDYTNATNRPAANVLLTGDVSGSSNVSLVAGTNQITISTTIQANSVSLGTDTVGPYVGNVVTGGNVTVSVSGEEGANVTISIPQAIGSNANVTFNNVTGSNAIFSPAIYGTAVYSGGSPVWTAANDGAGSGLDADTLDGLNSDYFTNYVNQNNKPAANIVVSGAISGTANTLLGANTNIISISTSVNNNSVTLGTHTVGDYTARVISGSAINVSGTADEGNVITVSHAGTSNLLGLIGTNGIANITVDTFGHVTAANTATYLTSESDTLATVTGRGATTSTAITINASAGANAITTTGNISVNGALVFTQNTDGSGSGLDADLLDGQQGTFYLNYNNLTNDPAANIVLSGNLLGSGNAVLTANSTLITLSARVADNSVTLGTHTIGRFIANVEQGTAIEVSGGGTEDAVATVSHSDTSTLSGLQGGAGISSVTVDGLGHVTAVGTATYLTTPGLNVAFTGDVTGTGNINLTQSSTNSLSIALTVQPNSVALGTDTTGNYVDRVVGGTGISVTGTADEGNVLTASLTSTGVVAATYGNATIVPVITVDAQGRITSASNVVISASGGTSDYNVLTNKPAANIVLSGDVSGSANALLTANSTILTISTTIQPNSVALGTDTTGNYVDRVVGGTGISVTGTADEGNVLTASLTSTGVVAATYGNATVVPIVTIDAQGRITSASNVVISASGGATLTSPANNFIVIAGTCSIASTGCNNIFIGANAGACTTFGCYNFFAGRCAGFSNTTGGCNNFFGAFAGFCNTTGGSNNFFGFCAGRCNTTGGYNNFFGFCAGVCNTTGSCNNFFGCYAGRNNTTGSNNNFFGNGAGRSNTAGCRNFYVGLNAAANLVTGNDNIVFGNVTTTVANTTSNIILIGTGDIERLRVENGNLSVLSGTGNILANIGSSSYLPDSGVTAATYGNATIVPVITIDAKGRITSASNVTISNSSVPRSFNTSSNATITPDISLYDNYIITALASNLTINESTLGSPVNGQKIIFRIKDNGNLMTITWSSVLPGGYRQVGAILPANTSPTSNVIYVGCIYNLDDTVWDVVAVNNQGG